MIHKTLSYQGQKTTGVCLETVDAVCCLVCENIHYSYGSTKLLDLTNKENNHKILQR